MSGLIPSADQLAEIMTYLKRYAAQARRCFEHDRYHYVSGVRPTSNPYVQLEPADKDLWKRYFEFGATCPFGWPDSVRDELDRLFINVHSCHFRIRGTGAFEVQGAEEALDKLASVIRRLESAVASAQTGTPATMDKPRWDKTTATLWYGNIKCAKYRKLVGNQVALLDAYERNGWSTPLQNPFKDSAKFKDTIKDLNSKLLENKSPIDFDRDFEQVNWTLCTADPVSPR